MRGLWWLCLWGIVLPSLAVEHCAQPLRTHTSKVSADAYLRDLAWLSYVFEQNGCTLVVLKEDVSSLGRLLRSLEEGKHDLATGLSITPERERYLYFSAPYSFDQLRLYVHKSYEVRSDWSLRQLLRDHVEIVLPMHGWFGDTFDEFRRLNLTSPQVITYQNDIDGLRIVRQHPESVLVISERVLRSLDPSLTADMEARGDALFSDPLHIGFSRASVSKRDFEYLNAAMAAMLKRGVTPDSFAAGKR